MWICKLYKIENRDINVFLYSNVKNFIRDSEKSKINLAVNVDNSEVNSINRILIRESSILFRVEN